MDNIKQYWKCTDDNLRLKRVLLHCPLSMSQLSADPLVPTPCDSSRLPHRSPLPTFQPLWGSFPYGLRLASAPHMRSGHFHPVQIFCPLMCLRPCRRLTSDVIAQDMVMPDAALAKGSPLEDKCWAHPRHRCCKENMINGPLRYLLPPPPLCVQHYWAVIVPLSHSWAYIRQGSLSIQSKKQLQVMDFTYNWNFFFIPFVYPFYVTYQAAFQSLPSPGSYWQTYTYLSYIFF